MRGAGWTDQRVDEIIGNLLRVGVIVAAAVVLLGGVLYMTQQASIPDYRAFRGEPAHLRSVSGIVKDAHGLDGRGLIQLGLLALLATPIARVGFSVLVFALQRDRTYVVVTLIVLGVLLYSVSSAGR
jgi:uncharacterized membrane protein